MLNIFRSGFFSTGREKIAEEINKTVTERNKALLIVPEQQTVVSEIELSNILPSYSPLYFEVTNFSRLANTTFRALGGITREYCSRAGKALIMWRTLTELSPLLNMTEGKREITAGLVESALMAIGEMQSLSISSDMLEKQTASEKIKNDKRLLAKLSDLSKIYTLYKKLLTEKYSDNGEDTDEMIRRLTENPDFLSGVKIYLEGFTSFTEPQHRLIEILAKRSEVSCLLHMPKDGTDFFEYSEIKDTEERLISNARKSSTKIKIFNIDDFNPKKKKDIALVVNSLWREKTIFDNISLQSAEGIRIFEASTPFEECSFVASDIKRRVMEGDAYRDFAIIMRSEKSYKGIIDGALSLAEIPYFSSQKKEIDSYEIIKLIYSAYTVIHSGFVAEDVLTYAKCGLSGISRTECDEFEGYVQTWQISGWRFTDDVVWNMNPKGLTSNRAPGTSEKLLRIHKTRTKLISPLHRLFEESSKAKKLKEHCLVLMSFLQEIKAEKALKERAAMLTSLSESALAEENERLWKLICDSLDTLVSISADCECSSEAFLGQLKILFSNVDIGKIPAHLDEVTVGSADMLRLGSKKHIYLIGVNAGEFPMAVKDSSYFTEKDKLLLSECGLSIRPRLALDESRELYFVSRSMSYADESVTLLYSSLNTRYKGADPSEVIERITKITGGALAPTKISSLEAKDRLYVGRQALDYSGKVDSETVKKALIAAGLEKELRISEGKIDNRSLSLGEKYKERLSSSPLPLSQTKIDTYLNCPLSYFCKYSLSLSEEKHAEFDASSIGTLIHAILENFFAELSRVGDKAGEISPEQRIDLTKRAAEKYIKDLGEELNGSSVKTKIKIDRLCRAALPVVEGLCEEFAVSEFMPKFFELSIKEGSEGLPSPIKFTTEGGHEVVIGGIIDRVDTYEKNGDVYVRVVDYKTGKKIFTPEDIKEGKNLQMFLYLHSIINSDKPEFLKKLGKTENGRVIPAGVIYVKTFVGDKTVEMPDDGLAAKAVKSEQKRLGMILDNPDIIKAMDMKYTPLYDERNKDKNKISEAKKKFLFTEDGFEDIMSVVEEVSCAAADGIINGEINASPKIEKDSSPCDFCEFKPICRKVSAIR